MTANCGTADVGPVPSIGGGNGGTVYAASAGSGTAGAGAQPTSANGNGGSVFPSPPPAPALVLIHPETNPAVGVNLVASGGLVS